MAAEAAPTGGMNMGDNLVLLAQLTQNLSSAIATLQDLTKRVSIIEVQLSILRERGMRLSEWRRINDDLDFLEKEGLMEEAGRIAREILAEERRGMN